MTNHEIFWWSFYAIVFTICNFYSIYLLFIMKESSKHEFFHTVIIVFTGLLDTFSLTNFLTYFYSDLIPIFNIWLDSL